jgi:dTDP-4-amino-4,6-dideoxygalactose transaminase
MREIKLIDLKKESAEIMHETLAAISKVIQSADYILGEDLGVFERSFADYVGTKYCIGVSNGTSALFLALKALGVGQGDEVITTAMSFAATTEAIVRTGATPIFIDVDLQTLSIDDQAITSRISPRTKAILPVHLYGTPANLANIRKICDEFGLFLVEDCAQAHGATMNGKKVGSFGDVGCFSFMPAKNIGAYGDAGCITTDNEAVAKRIIKLRNHGRDTKHIHDELGYAERLDNMQAAVLNVKLKYLDKWNRARNHVATKYEIGFRGSNIKSLNVPSNSISSFYVYSVMVENRDSIAQYLAKDGIQTGIYYPIPLHLQPAFSSYGYRPGDLPNAEKAAATVLALPMHPFLTDDEVEFIVNQTLKHANAE